jgi:hypothetical protein
MQRHDQSAAKAKPPFTCLRLLAASRKQTKCSDRRDEIGSGTDSTSDDACFYERGGLVFSFLLGLLRTIGIVAKFKLLITS